MLRELRVSTPRPGGGEARALPALQGGGGGALPPGRGRRGLRLPCRGLDAQPRQRRRRDPRALDQRLRRGVRHGGHRRRRPRGLLVRHGPALPGLLPSAPDASSPAGRVRAQGGGEEGEGGDEGDGIDSNCP